MRNRDYNLWLLPYLEGTLNAQQTAELEARLAADPQLAAEAERLRQTLGGLQATAARTQSLANAIPPADLWRKTLRTRIVMEPAPRRTPPTRLWWAAGASLAAASLISVGVIQQQPRQAVNRTDTTPRSVPMAAQPQIASREAGRKAAEPQTVRPAVPTPQKIADVLKSSAAPTDQADPFALPKPPVPPMPRQVPPTPRQIAGGVPPVQTETHIKPPVQIASSGSNAGHIPELAPNYYAAPLPAAPPPAPMTNMPVPVPASAPPLASDSAARTASPAFGALAAPPKVEDKPHLALKAKSQPNNLYQFPGLIIGQPAPTSDQAGTVTAEDQPSSVIHEAGLEDWQASLAAAMRPPLWGENAGMQQANQALMNVQMAGRLNDLRTQLETQREQPPAEVVTSRMLAAADDFGGFRQAALEERRHTVTLEGADGEDWFALAQLEERAGNGTAAKAAYQHALTSQVPPPPFHAAIAKQRSR